MKPFSLLALLALFVLQFTPKAGQTQKPSTFYKTLGQDAVREGFSTKAVYLNESGQPIGARFIHQATGYTLDLMQIESVPQAFIWVNSLPVSDQGEPHTQEHLLIGKGNKGRGVANRVGMSLGEFNAYTSQTHTVYDFNTAAGQDVFFSMFHQFMDALLHPDYTSEEVGREVRNWGVTENPDKTLRLEEKGSVYNEMSVTMNNSYSVLFDTLGRLLYGRDHPIAYSAGGLPAAIRTLDAKAIAQFHDEHYYPANMGAIVTLPSGINPDVALKNFDRILNEMQVKGKPTLPQFQAIPPFRPIPGNIDYIIPTPGTNAEEPSNMVLAFPEMLKLDATGFVILSNFLQVFAGDPSSNLYKIFVDSKTRQKLVQPQGVYSYLNNFGPSTVSILMLDLPASSATSAVADTARKLIIDELKRIAAFRPGSQELKEFNTRFLNNLMATGRVMGKLVNSPPRFGARNTYDTWYDQLMLLDREAGFRKSLVLKPQLAEIRKLITDQQNPWPAYLANWRLLSTTPVAVISRVDTTFGEIATHSAKQRSAAAVANFGKQYGLTDEQQIIARYKAVYDSTTTQMDLLEKSAAVKFLDRPPLTLDDQLIYTRKEIAGMPLVSSTFGSMSSATAGIAFDLHVLPSDKLVYLGMFPQLLTGSGVIENGKSMSYEAMSQRLLKEILSLEAYYSTNETTGRAELVVRGSGNDAKESAMAMQWMNRILFHPNWNAQNLPRLRDMVEQRLSGLRQTMRGAEESWVRDPGEAVGSQDQPLLLSTNSFLTITFNIFRLKWMLKHPASSTDLSALDDYLVQLSSAVSDRRSLQLLLAAITDEHGIADSAAGNARLVIKFQSLRGESTKLARDMALDLQQMLYEIPDNSLAGDWKFLCATIRRDVKQPYEKTFADLELVRKTLLNVHNARTFIISSAANETVMTSGFKTLASGFANTQLAHNKFISERLIDKRVMARTGAEEPPVFTGLINPNSQMGVFINEVPATGYADTSETSLLKLLAGELYAGGGKQSVFSKTIGAGLAYSNGISLNPKSGSMSYYAERTPELPQTLKFVIGEIKRTPVDSTMIDYTMALAIGRVRSAGEYETRGEAMAADLADGLTPQVVGRFRTALLRLRNDKELLAKIYAHKEEVYERVLPGYGIPSKDVKNGTFFVIGPEKQMQAYEAYLKDTNGEHTILYRIYPRDFWMEPVQ